MRKVLVIALAIVLAFIGLTPANAGTKATTVTAAFKTLLSTTSESLQALELKYESDINALDLNLERATAAANAVHTEEITANAKVYGPAIEDVTKAISNAILKFPSVSNVKVLALGTNRNYWGNLNCPITRIDCKDVDKGEKFLVGEVTTLKDVIGTKPAYLLEIDLMIGQGLIELVNRKDYLTISTILKNAPGELEGLQAAYAATQNVAIRKRDNAIKKATDERQALLNDLDAAYKLARSELEAKEVAANLALLAAKRASKDSNFDAAFVIAYKFEYNRQMLDQIADEAWTGEWTFRTIDSILKVNKLAVYGDSIGEKYSKSAASAFNAAVGNAFTNEPDFRAALKVLTTIYKQTTKTTLKF